MNIDTTIAKNIRVADEKASYDAVCKRLLSEKIILAWIMKNCMDEYRDCDVDKIADSIILNKIQEKFHLAEDTAKKYLQADRAESISMFCLK